jgi:hypothetical protein
VDGAIVENKNFDDRHLRPEGALTMTTSGFDWILAGTIFGLIVVAIGAYAALLWYVLG